MSRSMQKEEEVVRKAAEYQHSLSHRGTDNGPIGKRPQIYMLSFFKLAIAALLIAWIFYKVEESLRTILPIEIDGTTDPRFKKVREVFEENFKYGWEHEGSSIAVFVDGKQVVDLWGGYADRQSARKWKDDTLTITFSTTKAVAAICIALLAERGKLSYDDLVSKHWPGFAKNGKENVTIHHILAHMAGLGYVDTQITEAMARDPEVMRILFENEKPKWIPGTATGYHPYTYGWLVDQIVRHVDEKKRGIGQFLREEITEPNGIDYHIGLPRSESWRVARIHTPSLWERIHEVLHNWKVIFYFRHLWSLHTDTPLARAAHNPSWLEAVHRATFNNPEYYNIEQAAAMGIGNARSLGQIFNLFANEKIVNSKSLGNLQNYYINETDVIFGDKVAKGYGFLYLPLNRKGVPYLVGHTGHGCQNVAYDLKNKIVIAYVTNGLKTGLYKHCRTYYRLQNAIYDIIEITP